ncbi:MAG: acetyl-CoA carboxylase biotin carboxylase subunit [Actinomycetes bacterium]|jgi:acetyl-CoA carboxylase biotin carboxylase subunit|nr:acetyl-CoA carboxylase biotin carboxylase subunit [Actinomycetes bacterium]
MFDSILIANRGEVAVRIIRSAREMGIKTVAVYSQADAHSRHVRMADRAVCIGPAQSTASYLNQANIIMAALNTGAGAIHPGYGFLAENAEFARLCADEGLVFVGPSPDAITRMGNKSIARATAGAAGVPVVPGSPGAIDTVAEAATFADEVGYPVLVKASAGGGGKGMRVAHDADDLAHQFTAARTEAAAAFGDDTVYLEKYLARPKHIEIQILTDTHGNGVYLFERDCSVQRRHQKLIEEAPSVVLTPETRKEMGRAALRLAENVGYVGAGTVEFLYDTDGSWYFMEMNTRVQVEHPVTEAICGLDIIAAQIRIAAGEPLGLTQDDLSIDGHAIEFRINAEDPAQDFRPSPGTVSRFTLPGGFGVRVDTHLAAGETISPYYDSLIAKLIVHGADRSECIARARRALGEFDVAGVATTIPFHLEALTVPAFIEGRVYTDFVDTEMGGSDD